MKKSIVVAVLAVVLAAPAVASDMPERKPAKSSVVATAPIADWNGCYVGAHAGGARSQGHVNVTDPESMGGRFAAHTFYNSPYANGANAGQFNYGLGSSVIGGGTLGCNSQPTGSHWVFGVEGEAGYLNLMGSVTDPYSMQRMNGDTIASAKMGNWYGVVAGRVGYTWDRLLIYAKGGVGFADLKSSVTDACDTGACGVGRLTATASNTEPFGVVGGGLEWALDRNWSVKAEYLFLAFNNYRVCGPGSAFAAGSNFCSTHSIDGIHTAKIGLNFKLW